MVFGKMRLWWIVPVVLFSQCALAEEQLTITTYYPSPQGVYKQLKLHPNNTPNSCTSLSEGTMYYNNVTNTFDVCTDVSGTYAYRQASLWNLTNNNLTMANPVWQFTIGTTRPLANCPFTVDAGTLGTSGGDELNYQTLGSLMGTNANRLTTFARRKAGGGSSWATADFYLQRSVDVTDMGFIKWPGGGTVSPGDYGMELGYNTTSILRIDANGGVGVGTMSPQAKLSIYDNSSATMNIQSGTSNRWWIEAGGPGPAPDYLKIGGQGSTKPASYPLTIDSAGNIQHTNGVFGSGTRSNFYLSLQGDRNMVLYDSGSAIWNSGTHVSNLALKTNILELNHILPKVLVLQTVQFDWKDKAMGENRQIGFIAEQVAEQFPELVYQVKDRTLIDYPKMSVVLLAAVKEQQEQIEVLSGRLEKLEESGKIKP